jgi:hypothetical protein
MTLLRSPLSLPAKVPSRSYDCCALTEDILRPLSTPPWGSLKRKKPNMTNTDKLSEELLRQFTGTEDWHRFGINRKVLCTDVAKYVADEAGAYWLFDAIAQLSDRSVAAVRFQVWKLKVNEDRTAILVCDDGNDSIVYTQNIEFTDFLTDEIELYFTDNSILLPSDY